MRRRPGGHHDTDARIVRAEGADVVGVQIDLADHLSVTSDQHHELAPNARRAGEVVGTLSHVVDALIHPFLDGRAADTNSDRDAGVFGRGALEGAEAQFAGTQPVDANPIRLRHGFADRLDNRMTQAVGFVRFRRCGLHGFEDARGVTGHEGILLERERADRAWRRRACLEAVRAEAGNEKGVTHCVTPFFFCCAAAPRS